MASPQIENGHTRVANELLEAVFRFPFTAAQLRFILWVTRNSFGWGRKKTEGRSLAQMSDETKVPKASVGWAITTLLRAGVILKDDLGRYSLNKNFDEWMTIAADRLPLSNPLDEKERKPSNPLDESSNPLDETVQPIGRSYKELKKRKKEKKDGARSRTTFIPPTIEEVVAYCAERKALGKRPVNPEKWHDHYTARGWKWGAGKPVVDWRAAVRTWEHSDFGFAIGSVSKGAAAPVPGKYAR